jgi:peroxiredoxin Q/BCP
MINPPYSAPDFSLPDASGKVHSLIDYRGKWIVLYFYPKDDTPGCTIEAWAEVIGVSKDDASAHEKFKAKHTLNFTLLTDTTGTVIESYGAWGKKMYGSEGIMRKTFIINPEGMVYKIYGRVTPLGHGKQVIKDLTALQA